MIRKVNNLLEARSRTKTIVLQRGRKLSRRKVAQIPTGKKSVFERKIDGIKSNTALYVSTDISGSMKCEMEEGKTRLDVAFESLSALIYSVDKNKGSSISLTAFDGRIYNIKTFNETIAKAKNEINRICPSGLTCFTSSLYYGVKELSKVQSKHSRFVMVIITDGLPDDIDEAKVLIEKIRKSNIEVYGIGIHVSAGSATETTMEHIFGKECFVSINKAEEMQDEIIHLAHIAL